jgi:hypothetical protein
MRLLLPWLPQPPYLIEQGEGFRLRADVRAAGFEVAQADASEARSERDLLEAIGGGLGFPDYFRPNWDAFDDCLGDLMREPAPPTVILIEESDHLLRVDPHAFVRAAHLLSDVVTVVERERGDFRLEVFFLGTWQRP